MQTVYIFIYIYYTIVYCLLTILLVSCKNENKKIIKNDNDIYSYFREIKNVLSVGNIIRKPNEEYNLYLIFNVNKKIKRSFVIFYIKDDYIHIKSNSFTKNIKIDYKDRLVTNKSEVLYKQYSLSELINDYHIKPVNQVNPVNQEPQEQPDLD